MKKFVSEALVHFSRRRCIVSVRRRNWRGISSSTSDDNEEGLAQYWRDMERRVLHRKPRPRGVGPSGRGPRRKAEIDYWADEGLYDFTNKVEKATSTEETEEDEKK